MAIGVYKSKVSIPEIGINVASSNTKANSLQSISNSYAQTSNLFFQAAGDEAKKKATEFGMSVPIEKVMGINPDTQLPEAYSLPENYGTIAMDAFKQVIDQRFFEAIENDYRAKAKELYTKYSLDVAGFENAFLKYTSEVVDVAQGKFKEFAREVGINQTKGYVANIRSNIFAASVKKAQDSYNKARDELTQVSMQYGMGIEKGTLNPLIDTELDYNSNVQNVLPSSYFNNYVAGFIKNAEPHIKSGLISASTVNEDVRIANLNYLRGSLSDILSIHALDKNEVLSEAFANSILTGTDNKYLPITAREFIHDLNKHGANLDFRNKLITDFNRDQSTRSAARQADQDRLKQIKDDKIKREKQEKNSAINDNYQDLKSSLIKNQKTIIKEISTDNTDSIITLFNKFDTTEDSIRKRVVKNLDDDNIPNNSISDSQANQLINTLDDTRGKVVNAKFGLAINSIALTSKDSEKLIQIKDHVTQIFRGNVSVDKLNADLLGAEAFNQFASILTVAPDPETIVKNFSLDSNLSSLDTKIRITKDNEKITEDNQKALDKRKAKLKLETDRFDFQAEVDKRFNRILSNAKQGIINSDLNLFLSDLKTNGLPLEEYEGEVLFEDAASKIKKYKDDIASAFISHELNSLISENVNGERVKVKIQDLENILLFLNSGDNTIPIPENLKNEYNNIQKIYNYNAVENRTLFKQIVNSFKNRIIETQNKLEKIDIFVQAKSGLISVDPNKANDIYKNINYPEGNYNKYTHYTSIDRAKDFDLYSLIVHGNTPQDLIEVVREYATDSQAPEFQNVNTENLVALLLNMRAFPINNKLIDITPNAFYKDSNISKLMTVIDFAMNDENINVSAENLNILMNQVNQNTDAFTNFLELNKKKLDDEDFEFHVNKLLDVKGVSRLSDPSFFEMLDRELPVAMSLGQIKDIDTLDLFIEKRYKNIWKFSNEVVENPGNVNGGMTSFPLEKIFLKESHLKAYKEHLAIDKVMPFLKKHLDENFVEAGFAIKFGNQLFLSKEDYNEKNVITIMLQRLNDSDANPTTMISKVGEHRGSLNIFPYTDVQATNRLGEQFGVYFHQDGMPTLLPLGGLQQVDQLDPVTKFHYESIKSGSFTKEGDSIEPRVIGFNVNNQNVSFVVPTFWNGKLMPNQTEEDINNLVKVMKENGYELTDFPSFFDVIEADSWLRSTIKTWENIGLNKERAETILDQHSFQTTDIFKVNPFEYARTLNRIDAQKLNQEIIRKEFANNKGIISDHIHGYVRPGKFRTSQGFEDMSMLEAKEEAEKIIKLQIDERNALKRKAINKIKFGYLFLEDEFIEGQINPEDKFKIKSIVPIDGVHLPDPNQVLNRTKKDRFDNNGEGNFSDKLINLLKDLFK